MSRPTTPWRRRAWQRPASRVVAAVALTTAFAGRVSYLGFVNVGSSSASASPALTRRAINKDKLEQEATWGADFLKGIGNIFNQQPQNAAPDAATAARREEADAAIAMTGRKLRQLRLSIAAGAGDDGEILRRAAPIKVLQEKASQSVVLFVATKEEALRDMLLSMRIDADKFASRNVLVVPLLLDREGRSLAELSDRLRGAKLFKQGSIALPGLDDDEDDEAAWGELIAAEFDAAEVQGIGAQAESQGIAVVVRSSGEIVRRGVGRPIWENVFMDLGV
eukprot:TRINITY_DN111307_c0_g1_i1.p1 TRINITY_DN111307_c0_g1~~TRINITY_DN111307_c0_g1_i1.p1  ORF type:complete len:279 (-),score=83.38 TRINITY_DN111307_c0_g1_i1:60-896(-)